MILQVFKGLLQMLVTYVSREPTRRYLLLYLAARFVLLELMASWMGKFRVLIADLAPTQLYQDRLFYVHRAPLENIQVPYNSLHAKYAHLARSFRIQEPRRPQFAGPVEWELTLRFQLLQLFLPVYLVLQANIQRPTVLQ